MRKRLTILFLLCLFLANTAFTQTEAPSVRVIYLVSADREENPDYKAAIEMAIIDIQKWYRKQMKGRSFRLNEPIVEVLKSNQKAPWFTGESIEGVNEGDWGIMHTLSEVKRLLPNETIPGNYTWVLYSDGPGSSGRGGGQICYLPEDDLLGLTGQHPTQPEIPRWIAGLGHEIGHAFGLPHPSDTEKHANAIMWTGIYGKYPNETYLTPDDKATLEKSPFFMTDKELNSSNPIWQTTYSYRGGSFVRYKTEGGDYYWIENANDGSTYRFEETRSDSDYYYAFGRSTVTLKIPINGGLSYYSGDDGRNWNRNHTVSITMDESMLDNSSPKPVRSAPQLIRDHRKASNAALKANEEAQFLSYLTDDVQITTGNGNFISGKENLSLVLKENLDSVYWQRTTTEVRVNESQGLAWETGTWQMYNRDRSKPSTTRGKYSAMWTRESGTWLIKSELFVTLE